MGRKKIGFNKILYQDLEILKFLIESKYGKFEVLIDNGYLQVISHEYNNYSTINS